MAEKKVTVRMAAEGGRIVRAELQGLGVAGSEAFTKINHSQKDAAASASVFEAAIVEEVQAFNRLRASLDPAFAAQKRYETAVQQTRQAVRLGAVTQREANEVLAMVGRQSRIVGRGAGQAGDSLRMMGLQLSQVFQSASATGDPLRALAIQLPDIGLAFGTIGIAAGVAAGALLPLVGQFFEAGDSSEDAKEAMDNFLGSLDAYRSYADRATAKTSDLREEFGRFAEEMRAHARFMAQVSLSEAMGGLDQAVDTIRTDLDEAMSAIVAMGAAKEELENAKRQMAEGVATSEQVQTFQENFEGARDAARGAAEAFGMTVAELVQLNSQLKDVGRAEGMEEVRAAAQEVLDTLDRMYSSSDNIPPVVAAIAGKMHEVLEAATQGVLAAEDLEDPLNGAGDAARIIASVDMASGISAAASRASALAAELRAAAAAAIAIGQYGNTQPDSTELTFGLPSSNPFGPGVGGDTPLKFGDPDAPMVRDVMALITDSSRGGGGGGGGTSEAQKRENELMREAERIRADLRTETERYNDELADLRELQELGYLSTEEFRKAQEQLTAEFRAEQFKPIIDGIEKISDALADAIVNGESMGEALGNVFKQIASDLLSSGIRELLMQVFGFGGGGGGGGGLLGLIFGGGGNLGSTQTRLPSFDGGGYTGSAPRSGGLDGKGGFLAMMHPRERVTDLTRGGADGPRTINVNVEGAQGNTEVREMVQAGVREGLREYDRRLPGRVQQIGHDPRVRND